MITVSNNFKTAMKQPIKEIQAFIDYGDGSLNDSNDLISFKISCDSGLCKTAMRKLEAKYLGSHNLLGKWVRVGYGVRLPDGSFDWLDYGSFLVTELTVSKDTETTSITGYDKMINAMTPYTKLEIEYPARLIDYTRGLCNACGLELGNVLFGSQLLDFNNPMSSSPSVTSTFENEVLTVSTTGGTYQNSMWDILTLFKNNKGKTLYFDYEDIDLSNAKSPIIQLIITENGTNTYKNLVASNGNKVAYVIPENVENITAVKLGVYCNNTSTAGAYSLTITKPMVQLGTEKLAYQKYNTMNDWQITATKDGDGNVIDLWENINGITYRDIFVQIAQATASTCVIGTDDKVYFKPLTDTGESLTYDNMFKLKLEALYGEINSVVLARTPVVGEDIFLQDEASVRANGLTEFKIENNEIIDKNRENAITPIFEFLRGISYYPFEATTEGLGWYEIGDNITIINDLGEEFKTSLFNYSITVDGSIKEMLKTTAENKTQTQYQYATSLSKRIKNTEIMVNKQEGYIQSLVSDVDGVNEKYSKIFQDIDGIVNSVQNSGGNNLIKNSVMFAYDNSNLPSDWVLEGDGTLLLQSDTEAMNNGGVSGHSFTLSNRIVRQRVQVTPNIDGNNVYYTFSTKIKKGSSGECYVKLYNDSEEHIISLPVGESAYYKDYELKAIAPKENYFFVEFYGSAESNATFTDNMLAVGEYKAPWTQANGEVMNTQVIINIDGITVKSSVHLGDYTVISPVEFSGYSIINGVPTKVFTLNQGVTKVKQLEAEDEIKMLPLKVVAITEGDIQGWAFVPSTQGGVNIG